MRITWSVTVRGSTAAEMKERAQKIWDAFTGEVPYPPEVKSKPPYRSHIEIRATEGIMRVDGGIIEYEGIAEGWVEI